MLLVPDVTATADFYRTVLGFQADGAAASSDYTVVWRDNAALHFARSDRAPSGVRVFFWVKDVEALYAEVTRRGGPIAVPMGTRPYGIRDFSIRDPNGVELVFGQDWDE